MNKETTHDNNFFEILRECKNLPNFLDAVFGFLKRRTDFYYIAKDAHSAVGLPEGVAEHCVKDIFYKWKRRGEIKPEVVPIEIVPHAIEEVVIDSSEGEQEFDGIKNMSISNEQSEAATFTHSESYNGAVFDKYSWSQTIRDLDIIVKIPENVTSKDIAVQIFSQSIIIKLKNENTLLLKGELCEKVKHKDVIWSLDKQKLEIHLEKLSEFWWNCLLKQEPKIDIQRLDCSRPYDELSEEAQAKIEELSWNQEQKRLGLPTSDEIILQNKLKGVWNTKGSPFKGKIDPNNVVFKH